MKIIIGSDHAGVELKQQIINTFINQHEFVNVGTNTIDSVDYPDIAHRAVTVFKEDNCDKIILICDLIIYIC